MAPPSSSNCETRQPRFSPAVAFSRLFDDDLATSWLLSKETHPPTLLKPDTIQDKAITIDGMILTDPQQPGLVYGRHDPQTASGESTTPVKEAASNIESVAFIFHGSTERYALLTTSDTRVPFAFLEPAGCLVPDIHRCIVECTSTGYLIIFCYWLTDGRSNIVMFFLDVYPQAYSERHLLLLAPYPSYRYPATADILETCVLFDELTCQFCFNRGSFDCQCDDRIQQRMNGVPRTNLQRNESLWKWIKWVFQSFESGVKKYQAVFSNASKNIIVPTVAYSRVMPSSTGSLVVNSRGFQSYLTTISSYFSQRIDNHNLVDSSRISRSGMKRKLLSLHGADAVEASPSTKSQNLGNDLSRSYPHECSIPETANALDEKENAAILVLASSTRTASESNRRPLLRIADLVSSPEEVGASGIPQVPSHHLVSAPHFVANHELISHTYDLVENEEGMAGQTNQSFSPSHFGSKFRTTTVAQEYIKEQVLELLERLDSTTAATADRSCPACGKSFSRKHDLKRHVMSNHLEQKEFECTEPECHARFSRNQHLISHINTIHRKLSSFACPYCDKCYTAPSTRRTHIKRFHPGMSARHADMKNATGVPSTYANSSDRSTSINNPPSNP